MTLSGSDRRFRRLSREADRRRALPGPGPPVLPLKRRTPCWHPREIGGWHRRPRSASDATLVAQRHGEETLPLDHDLRNEQALCGADRGTRSCRRHHGSLRTDAEPPGARRARRPRAHVTKWFAPGFPHMVGVVGGDIVGQFGGAVLKQRLRRHRPLRSPDGPSTSSVPRSSRSLTIRVEGAQDTQTNTAVLDGRVVDGH